MTSNRPLAALLKREEGSFAVEASLVFPALFVALIALLMLSMYVYQTVAAYHGASLAAERTAFRWDNSARDPVSGIGPTGSYDGLYWRMTDNGALRSLFDLAAGGEGEGGIEIAVGVNGSAGAEDGDEEDASLPVLKMRAEGARVAGPFQGTMRYSGTLEKRVDAKLRQPLSIPVLEAFLGHSEPAAEASASIADPVELIRNVELARYYAGKFKGGMSGDQRKQAQAILIGRQGMEHG
ncbi:pilus assembly protein [Paenibacillus sp. MWE-103]|uniref:Pilus assembly protein n=1 Tax=Paenibacillus artemisiicola TaxID=1172618 RepID=A0ABS3WHF4_9BACL|nr:TadE family protein [Paenibacillus artemisiicola]MBO7747752.1 pilus assembly protein [Paenibacillus artemisiicola]